MHQAAQLLENEVGHDVCVLRREYRTLLGAMGRGQAHLGALAGAVTHFRKVSKSYWLGLFRCYETPELPRTNNDLEQYFGSARYQERRASGRKVAAPGLVVRGRVRLVAAMATGPEGMQAADLRPTDLGAWRTLRADLEARQEGRRQQLRFRRDPETYLRALEERLLKPSLPA